MNGETVAAEPVSLQPPWSFDGLHLITLAMGIAYAGNIRRRVTSRDGTVLPVGIPVGAEIRAAPASGETGSIPAAANSPRMATRMNCGFPFPPEPDRSVSKSAIACRRY